MKIRNDFCHELGIEYPILLGPMVVAGSPELVAAVSGAGGMGILPTGMYDRDSLAEVIDYIRTLTEMPFALNLPVRNPQSADLIEVIAQKGVKWATTSAGSPDKLTKSLHDNGVRVFHVVPSVHAAKKAEAAGVDGVIAEGGESGGFLASDDVSTLVLVPQVADAVSIPVIAAGGIGDGRGLVAALALGAAAVQIGTAFIATPESGSHENVSQALIEAKETQTVRFGPPGMSIRALRNKLIIDAENETDPETRSESMPEIYAKMGLAMMGGDTENGLVVAGSVAGMITQIKPAAQIVTEIIQSAESALKRLCT